MPEPVLPTTLSPTQKYCHACASVLDVRAEICPKCGVRQAELSGASEKRSRVTAGIFALILGGIGVHKFYLGKPVQGVLYILFCWTLVPSIIGLVEGIVYLTMSDASFAAKYG
ncbi:MAG TPA: TM2 domain-containing protein [Anaeromyxobacteraceae bacterium]|nr:TM2 domain-containing protein [Anaeromyxobacteraceae bacterium]